jgi:hypothetical protein
MRLGMAPARLARKFVSILLAYLLVGSGLLGALPVHHGFDSTLQVCAQTAETSAPRGQPDAPPAHGAQDCCLAACFGPVADLVAASAVAAPGGPGRNGGAQTRHSLLIAHTVASQPARAPPVS